MDWFEPAAVRLTKLYFTDRYVDDSPDPEPDAAECASLLIDVERLHSQLFPGSSLSLSNPREGDS